MTYPDRTLPTFKAWNDSLIRERQLQEMDTIEFGSGELMPIFTGQQRDSTDGQEEEEEEEEEHDINYMVDDEAIDDNGEGPNGDNDADEEEDKASSDHAVSIRRAEKGKAQASQSSTESGDSVLDEVNSTLYLSDNFKTQSQC